MGLTFLIIAVLGRFLSSGLQMKLHGASMYGRWQARIYRFVSGTKGSGSLALSLCGERVHKPTPLQPVHACSRSQTLPASTIERSHDCRINDCFV